MSTEASQSASAEDLVTSYDATSDVLDRSAEEKAIGMMIDECLLRICERTEGKPGASLRMLPRSANRSLIAAYV